MPFSFTPSSPSQAEPIDRYFDHGHGYFPPFDHRNEPLTHGGLHLAAHAFTPPVELS